MNTFQARSLRWFAAILISFGMAACQLAPYDAETYNASAQCLKNILAFFDTATEATGAKRSYDNLKSSYASIENDLVVLGIRERTRADNKESAHQAQLILEQWQAQRRIHRCRYISNAARSTGQGADCAGAQGVSAVAYGPDELDNDFLEKQRQRFTKDFEALMASEAYKAGAPSK